MLLAAIVGIAITEQSLVAVIGAVGGVCVALITAFGSAFVVLANRARKSAAIAAHESRPNSGSTQRDSINRIESMVQTLIKDVGDTKTDVAGLREENRNDRKADADRFDTLDDRLTHMERQIDRKGSR